MENNQIFVKLDEYKDILGVVEVINGKLDTIKQSLAELSEIKRKEDEHMEKWNGQLDLVSEKMNYINNTLKEI